LVARGTYNGAPDALERIIPNADPLLMAKWVLKHPGVDIYLKRYFYKNPQPPGEYILTSSFF